MLGGDTGTHGVGSWKGMVEEGGTFHCPGQGRVRPRQERVIELQLWCFSFDMSSHVTFPVTAARGRRGRVSTIRR